MCVKLIVTIPTHGCYLGEIERAAQSVAPVELHLEHGSTSVSSQPLVFSVAEKGVGCGCSWVVDVGDSQEDYWRFRPDAVEAIATLVKIVLGFATSPPEVTVAWLGVERPEHSAQTLRLDELLGIIRTNRVIPGRKYLVATGA